MNDAHYDLYFAYLLPKEDRKEVAANYKPNKNYETNSYPNYFYNTAKTC